MVSCWFHGLFIMLMNNPGLIFILRVAIYFLTWLFCVYMATLNWNFHFYVIWTLYCWIIWFLSRICLRNPRYFFTLQHNRVANFLTDVEIWFQNWWQMMGKIWGKITMHSDSFEEFFLNLAFSDPQCREGSLSTLKCVVKFSRIIRGSFQWC